MELAVSVTILLIIVAGLIDLGRVIFYYLSLRDAAQEAMIYGSIYPTFCDQIRGMVMSNVNDTSLQVDVLYDGNNTFNGYACSPQLSQHNCEGKQIYVIVTQPNFPLSMPMIGGIIGTQNIRLEARIKGTVLSPVCPSP